MPIGREVIGVELVGRPIGRKIPLSNLLSLILVNVEDDG
jgi:hypothetical protein